MNRFVSVGIASAVLFGITACDQSISSQVSAVDTPQSEELQAPAWILMDEPAGALSIVQARADMKEGDQVVIRGRVGGRKSPISSESSVFTIVDLGLEYCGQSTDDRCKYPWDYCCESPETITNNSATVRLVGGDEIDLTAGGLEPLDEIVLVGIVGARPNDQVFTIQGSGVYILP